MEPNTASFTGLLIWQILTIISAVATISCVALIVIVKRENRTRITLRAAELEWTLHLVLASTFFLGLTMLFWIEMPVLAS